MAENIKLYINSVVNGIIQMSISAFWIWHFGQLLYSYKFHPSILRFFVYPDWTLILFILMGICGFLLGLRVLLNKLKIKKGYFLIISLFIIGLVVDYIVIS